MCRGRDICRLMETRHKRQKVISLIIGCLTDGIQLDSGHFSDLFSLMILLIKAKNPDYSENYKG